MVTGTLFTGHFPQATRAEAIGFDALAHDLFASAPAVEQNSGTKKAL